MARASQLAARARQTPTAFVSESPSTALKHHSRQQPPDSNALARCREVAAQSTVLTACRLQRRQRYRLVLRCTGKIIDMNCSTVFVCHIIGEKVFLICRTHLYTCTSGFCMHVSIRITLLHLLSKHVPGVSTRLSTVSMKLSHVICCCNRPKTGLRSNQAFLGSRSALASSCCVRLARGRSVAVQRQNICLAQLGIFYSTSTGHTEDIASLIKEVAYCKPA